MLISINCKMNLLTYRFNILKQKKFKSFT